MNATRLHLFNGVSPCNKAGLYESRFDLFAAEAGAIQALKTFCEGALRSSLRSLAELTARGRDIDAVVIELLRIVGSM